MAAGRAEHLDRLAWNHTSHILTVLINVNRDPKKRAVKPAELNPYLASQQGRSQGIPLTAENLRMLSERFRRESGG